MLAKKYRLLVQWVVNQRPVKTIREGDFVFKAFSNNLGYNRFGVVIAKKTANKAVERNRLKRLFFSAWQTIAPSLSFQGLDCLLIINNRKFFNLQQAILALNRATHLIQ